MEIMDQAFQTMSVTVPDQNRLDLLSRGLSGEFPLHSMSELRRIILEAEEDLWPRKDATEVLDRARHRLHEGLVG